MAHEARGKLLPGVTALPLSSPTGGVARPDEARAPMAEAESPLPQGRWSDIGEGLGTPVPKDGRTVTLGP